MNLLLKAAISLAVILGATVISRRWSSLGGLIAVMPLTGLLVLVWVAIDRESTPAQVEGYVRGALLGLIPTALFFATALLTLRKGLPLPFVLLCGFAAWGVAAALHQWLLR